MNILQKVLTKIKSVILSKRNGEQGVSIYDYGNAYVAIRHNFIQGNGILKLCPNSIYPKETMKLRIDEGGKLIVNGTVSFFY